MIKCQLGRDLTEALHHALLLRNYTGPEQDMVDTIISEARAVLARAREVYPFVGTPEKPNDR